jgi:hypothetical protein
MKRLQVLYVCVSVSLVFSLLCGVGNALEQNELDAYVVLTSQNAYPGGTMMASVHLKSNSTEILTIMYVGIHFDWMPSDKFLGYDLSSDPVGLIPSAEKYLDPITIVVPANVTVGEHSYFVGVDGLEGSTDQFNWDSQTFTLVVKEPKEEEYNVLLPQVSGNITGSEEKNYQSPKAQSLLEQAKDAREQAIDYGTQNNWNEAVSMLNNALTYLKQTDAEEQKYLAETSFTQMLLIIIGIAVAAIVVILVTVYLMKKRKQNKISAPEP